MLVRPLLSAAAFFFLAGLAHAGAEKELDKKDACNADNLLRLMRGAAHLADSQQFCPGYICNTPPPATTTVYYRTTFPVSVSYLLDASHPMVLYNLQKLSTPTPAITYASPPTPITVPGAPNPAALECFPLPSEDCYPYKKRRDDPRRGLASMPTAAPAPADFEEKAKAALELRQVATTTSASCPSQTVPSWISATYPASRVSSACSCILFSTTTAQSTVYAVSTAPTFTETCTSYTSGAPRKTYAAYCDPSLYTNAIASPTTPAGVSAAEATSSVDTRIDCCQACADIYNCVFWKYTPDTTFAPGPIFVDGFDPWSPGSCVVGYQTGVTGDPGQDSGQPAVCPNGVAGLFLDYSEGQHALAGTYNSLFMNGWNDGPCGSAVNIYESNQACGCSDICSP